MDDPNLDPAAEQEPVDTAAQLAYRGYDDTTLGVECAWPVAEREVVLALS